MRNLRRGPKRGRDVAENTESKVREKITIAESVVLDNTKDEKREINFFIFWFWP